MILKIISKIFFFYILICCLCFANETYYNKEKKSIDKIIKKNQNNLNIKNELSSNKKKDDKKTQSYSNLDSLILTNNKIGVKNLFINFDEKNLLNFDYKKIKFKNLEFLENDEELEVIKRVLSEQQDPKLKKNNDEKKINQYNDNNLNFNIEPERSLHVSSLVFFNEKKWKAKINHSIVEDVGLKTFFDKKIKIVKVNKTNIVFLIQNSNNNDIKNVRIIKNSNMSYSDSYSFIKKNGKTYIVFKLYVGQKINLDTMKISG